MDALSVIVFNLDSLRQESDGPTVITPEVDGVSLVELVRRFEADRSYKPSGRYGGLIPKFFRFGDLTEYYLGVAEFVKVVEAGGCLCG